MRTHCLSALKALDDTNQPFYVKIAALYHDVGKVEHCLSPEGKVRFTNHAKLSYQLAKRDFQNLKFPRRILEKSTILIREHMSMLGGKKSITKLVARLGEGGVKLKQFIWLKYADSKANMKTRTDFNYFQELYKQCVKVVKPEHIPSVRDLVISGTDVINVLGVPEGRLVGTILKTLWQEYLDGKVDNSREDLLKRGNEIKDEISS